MSAQDRGGRPIAPWRPRTPGNVDVGTRMVCTQLQVEHLRELPGRGTDTVHGALADRIASEARRLDDLQSKIVQLAGVLREDLQRVIEGRDAEDPHINGILQHTAPAIDLLAARRTELHRSLSGLVEVYQTLPPLPATPSSNPPPVRQRATAAAPRRRTATPAVSPAASPGSKTRQSPGR